MENAAAGHMQLIDWLLSTITGARTINRIEASGFTRYKGTAIPPFEFANKMLKGDIIEATAFNDNICGTDITKLSDKYLYVYNYSPESLHCLKGEPRVEVLPIECIAPDDVRLKRMIKDYSNNQNFSGKDMCYQFLEDEKKDWEIDYKNHCIILQTGSRLNLKKAIRQIKAFNNEHHMLSNLDNFIQ